MESVARLQLEQSTLKEKTHELLKLDPQTLTPEQRTEMSANTDRLQQLEPELRAALVVQNTERAAAVDLFEDGKEDGNLLNVADFSKKSEWERTWRTPRTGEDWKALPASWVKHTTCQT